MALQPPSQAGSAAGLAAFQNEQHWYFLGVRRIGDELQVFLEKNKKPASHYFKNNFYFTIETEEPELPDYPKDPAYLAKFGPRGVLRCAAGGKIEDTGPLTKKRMETIDDETSAACIDFLERQAKADLENFKTFIEREAHAATLFSESLEIAVCTFTQLERRPIARRYPDFRDSNEGLHRVEALCLGQQRCLPF